jgi:hypothetical protein
MFDQPRWHREAWVPLVAGLAWLWCAASFGLVGFLFSVIPGCLLLASGVSVLLYPGDRRIPHYAAFGGLLGVPLAVPALFVAGPGTGLLLIGLSAASFVAAGAISVTQEPHVEEVPSPEPSLRLAAEVAADDALLGLMALTLPAPSNEDRRRVAHEMREARELFHSRGWLEKPASYHVAPPPLGQDEVDLRRIARRGLAFEHLRFESGYEPHPDEPGRARWLSYGPNRTAHAWVLRHDAPERPWLVCIHGYQMGAPRVDLAAFQATRLHHGLGLNLVLPVLPLHGPRKIGRISGDGFLAGDFLDSIHAEAQAMWDVRRILAWVRAQGAERVGVHGLSLGGYNAALLAGLDENLACAIPGIPATDFTRLTWLHGPPLQLRMAERQGMVHDVAAEVSRVISPLVLEPRVPFEHRAIFGAISDLLVPPDQVRDLWRHWGRPRIAWYQGSHMTFRLHPQVDALLLDTLRNARLIL